VALRYPRNGQFFSSSIVTATVRWPQAHVVALENWRSYGASATIAGFTGRAPSG